MGSYKGFQIREGTLDKYVVDELKSYNDFFHSLKASDVVLDVGGNIGSVAQSCAKMGCSVISFEPFLENFELLKTNTSGLKVKAMNAALVKDRMRTVDFYLNPGSNQGSHSQFVKRGRQKITVAAHCVSDLEWEEITAVKMDAEGAEYELLPEILELGKRVKLITAELHLNKKEWKGDKTPKLLKLFESKGWKLKKQLPDLDKRWHVTGVWSHE